ncbi:MAG: metallophosphoesterase [Terriglobales bacterium]
MKTTKITRSEEVKQLMGPNPEFNASSPETGLARPKFAKSGTLLRGYLGIVALWRAVVALLILAPAAYIATHSEFVFIELTGLALLVILIASQIFWISRFIDLGEWLLTGKLRRTWIAIALNLGYLFMIAYSYPSTIGQGHTFRIGFYRLSTIVTEAVFWWWFVGSMLAFLLVIAIGAVDRIARAAAWVYRKARQPAQPHATTDCEASAATASRRHFLQQTAILVSATPFVAAGYGLLYGRRDVDVVRQRVRLARLPKAFEGFRIAQLSDVHLGPFTTANYIRRCVAITNGLNPDLIALTGDYIAWDPGAAREVADALAGLRAPHGVFGCLGNHEAEGETEEFITSLFTVQDIHILRQARAPVQLGDETLNLIGIDDPRGESAAERKRDLYRRLHNGLVMPGMVNILLTHEPSVVMFDRAAELGIDLTLAGHTHGGQLALNFIDGRLNLSQLLYRCTTGWYERRGAQLYVNRGIGTTGIPIRLGARPEITMLELART